MWICIPFFFVFEITFGFSVPNKLGLNKMKEFGVSQSIPKAETGVLSLLEKNPQADGRGVKIAVLDTGCDLRAGGLERTTDGKRKYLDFIDCTGDGDVMMKKWNSTGSEGMVGLSGRNLVVGDWMKEKEVWFGAVQLFHLLPGSVKRRVKKERKERFLVSHSKLTSEVQQSLDELEKDKKKERKELELLLEELTDKVESYEDFGPLLDVVAFKEEETWKVVVDVNGDGKLGVPFAPYAVRGETGELGFGSGVTFCVQVYEGGKVVSIVTDAGSHGTHVAGIAAANFGNHKNGVAPGAQVLACKIGDGRLGSAETGTGLVRALIAAKKHGCDLVNLSYGEPSWQPDKGRVSQTFTDAVNKWGMTIFTSAGNDGPALSSLGSPGALSAPITVGAYVSPAMSLDQYSTLPPLKDQPPLQGASYYFSSRGPTPDGAMPDLCAPGGAIAPVPRHTLQGKAQYHGTSMSSPNACGVAACVLSALKQQGLTCSPTELRRALTNSATSIDLQDPFSQGAGLISAVSAVDYVLAHHGKPAQDLSFAISVPSRNNARGIYIRDTLELEGPMTFGILVKPQFHHAIQRTPEEMEELLSLELDLDLKASKPWVSCPDKMTLMSAKERNGQSFSIRLQTQELKPGAHFETIEAFDASDPARGVIFSVPITVIVPHHPSKQVDPDLSIDKNGMDLSMAYTLDPGAPSRKFLTVPQNAEWATIKVQSANSSPSNTSPSLVMLHALGFVSGDLPNTQVQSKKVFKVTEGVPEKIQVRVKGGCTLEVCLQLLWLANPSPISLLVDVEYHSFNIRPPTLVSSQPILISPAQEFARTGASAMLRSEKLNPTAKLETIERTIRPASFNVVSGSPERDILPPSDAEIKASPAMPTGTQIYDMFLTYTFKLEAEKPIKVTPCISSLMNQIYDSPLDSQIWVLQNSHDQVLGYGGAIHQADSISLSKGTYNITLHLRHPNRALLQQLKDLPCKLSLALAEPLPCSVYSGIGDASTPSVTNDDRSSFKSTLLKKGSHQDLYVARPTKDIPTWALPGDIITGSFTLDKDNAGATSMKLVYVLPPKPTKKTQDDPPDDEEEESLEDAVFDSKIAFLSKLGKDKTEAYAKLQATLKEERPSSLPLLLQSLKHAKTVAPPATETNEIKWRANQIQNAQNAMRKENGGSIDVDLLAQYFGVNLPSEEDLQQDKEARALKKKMNEHRNALRAALLAASSALGDLAAVDESAVEEFNLSVKELKKWVAGSTNLDNDDDKVSLAILFSRHARVCENKKATAMSILVKATKDHPGEKSITEEMIKLYQSYQGMDHLTQNAKNDMFNRFPVAKQGFNFLPT